MLGTPEIIQKLTRQTLLAFYRRHYVPESFTLVVVGPVNPAEILQAAERTLGRLPRSGFQRLPQSMPGSLTPKKTEIQRPGALAYLGMGWLGPKLDHADTPAVDLLVSMLGESRSSRLPQALRERLGLVNSVSSNYQALEAGGVITVTAQLEAENLARAETEILNEIRRLRDRDVSDEELASSPHARRGRSARSAARPPRGAPSCSATRRPCGGSVKSSRTSIACDRSRRIRFVMPLDAIWISRATDGSSSFPATMTRVVLMLGSVLMACVARARRLARRRTSPSRARFSRTD